MLDLIKSIKEIIAIVLPLLASIILLISKVSKNYKLRKFAESILVLEKVISDYMCKAEEFITLSGCDKKEWVKIKVNKFCNENNIKFNETEVDNLIENFIEISKKVNKREKDMVLL